MAEERARIEDAVKDIIKGSGIDSRPRTIAVHGVDKAIIKPNNEDAEWLVNTSDGSIIISLSAGENNFTHHLGREPEGFKVRYINADERIYSDDTTWAKNTKNKIYLQATGTVKAKITVF